MKPWARSAIEEKDKKPRQPRKTRPLKERIETGVIFVDECWIWKNGLDENGYARFCLKRGEKKVGDYAHRVSFEVYRGEIPKGHFVTSTCGDRACVNPKHLKAVKNNRGGWYRKPKPKKVETGPWDF